MNTSALRRRLDDWFDVEEVRPQIVGEFEDSALLEAFGAAGGGVFPALTAIAARIERMADARRIGDVEGVAECCYVISPERRLKHLAVVRITEAALARLFD